MRTATIYFLLTLVVSMDYGISCTCPTDWCLEDISLPAAKTMWEALDEMLWENSVLSNRPYIHTLTFGDLLKVQESPYQNQIELWYENINELGLLITIAINIVL
jgi:hypothetical protein